jgi:hypothetical protein
MMRKKSALARLFKNIWFGPGFELGPTVVLKYVDCI